MGEKTKNWVLTGVLVVAIGIIGYFLKFGVNSITSELKNINKTMTEFGRIIAVQQNVNVQQQKINKNGFEKDDEQDKRLNELEKNDKLFEYLIE